jgi:hypothetical protein
MPPADANADADEWRRQASLFAACFAKRGFDLAHPFSVDAFNKGLRERHDANARTAAEKGKDPPPPTPPFLPTRPGGASTTTVALLVGNTGASFWPCFLRWLTANNDPTQDFPPDPLDAFVVEAVSDAVAEATGCGAAANTETSLSSCPSLPPPLDVRFSHVMRPPDRFVDVLRAAAGSGMAYFSLAAHLCAHTVAGPYFSLRAVVVLDAAVEAEAEGDADDTSAAMFAPDAEVERLMALSADAADAAAWPYASPSSSSAAASTSAAAAVQEQWLQTYGRVLPWRQRHRDPGTVVSRADERRVGEMYTALFSAAAGGKKEEKEDEQQQKKEQEDERMRRGEAAAGRDKPWKAREAWRAWADARHALGGDRVAERWRFSEAQLRYHYTRDRDLLRGEVERVRREQQQQQQQQQHDGGGGGG